MMDQDQIKELKALERHQNGGVGVGAVRTVILFLERGQLDEACRARVWDGDKIDLYPEVKEWMDRNLCDSLGKEPKKGDDNEN